MKHKTLVILRITFILLTIAGVILISVDANAQRKKNQKEQDTGSVKHLSILGYVGIVIFCISLLVTIILFVVSPKKNNVHNISDQSREPKLVPESQLDWNLYRRRFSEVTSLDKYKRLHPKIQEKVDRNLLFRFKTGRLLKGGHQ